MSVGSGASGPGEFDSQALELARLDGQATAELGLHGALDMVPARTVPGAANDAFVNNTSLNVVGKTADGGWRWDTGAVSYPVDVNPSSGIEVRPLPEMSLADSQGNLPPIDTTGYFGKGFFSQRYDMATGMMNDPSLPWYQRTIAGGLATAIAPMMLTEEAGRGILNVPADASIAGQLWARSNLQSDPADATVDRLNATVHMTSAFGNALAVGSLAEAPLNKAVSSLDNIGLSAPKSASTTLAPEYLPGYSEGDILAIPKGARPPASDYLTQAYQDAHAALFEDGVVRIQPSAPTGTIGRTETWVIPKSVANDAIAKAGGDVGKLEQLLGYDPGYLGSSPVRIDIPAPTGYRIPTGNEFGANNYWRPGGLTSPGGLPEAVIKPVPAGSYVVSPAF